MQTGGNGCQTRMRQQQGTAEIDLAHARPCTAISGPVACAPLAPFLTHRHEAIDVTLLVIEQGIGKTGRRGRLQPGKPLWRVKRDTAAARQLAVPEPPIADLRYFVDHFDLPVLQNVTQRQAVV